MVVPRCRRLVALGRHAHGDAGILGRRALGVREVGGRAGPRDGTANDRPRGPRRCSPGGTPAATSTSRSIGSAWRPYDAGPKTRSGSRPSIRGIGLHGVNARLLSPRGAAGLVCAPGCRQPTRAPMSRMVGPHFADARLRSAARGGCCRVANGGRVAGPPLALRARGQCSAPQGPRAPTDRWGTSARVRWEDCEARSVARSAQAIGSPGSSGRRSRLR